MWISVTRRPVRVEGSRKEQTVGAVVGRCSSRHLHHPPRRSKPYQSWATRPGLPRQGHVISCAWACQPGQSIERHVQLDPCTWSPLIDNRRLGWFGTGGPGDERHEPGGVIRRRGLFEEQLLVFSAASSVRERFLRESGRRKLVGLLVVKQLMICLLVFACIGNLLLLFSPRLLLLLQPECHSL